MSKVFFPPEWYSQSAIQLTWPHEFSDWAYMLEEISACFVNIAQEILKRQKLIIVCHNSPLVKFLLGDGFDKSNLILVEIPSNDTWARDHGSISVLIEDKPVLYDFTFNGWGMKFAANSDNLINRELFKMNCFAPEVQLINKKDFVLEGGSLETDGKGTLLTTSECLLSPNRNSYLDKGGVEEYLKKSFGLNRVLWVDYGYLAGDDTDSHIDTLARFCDERTIAYVKCDDPTDEHHGALSKMEEQLRSFTDFEGKPYNLIPLPMANKVMEDGERLPATYANFLIINGAVLVPTYKSNKDKPALEQIQKAFPDREIIGINCLPIIKQHGSLHCVTMQYPENYVK
ncbi:agmatine deiminase family protein [Dysgonomonas sp. 216]|uniref:agmatine deiminase family protein n=1 Tax=Dysgonomonas sp. 216 TaxID=2302934 RepID=UPI0013D8D7A8|nr:agmatine deiminase family protein [Dysgonomonas sp. 216]NDW18285.1 agmatine deiminase family protein [Dysgonomonas sp. 216]NDW18653.1 agmatine deiminase family protein [Dysgonomonas sp. 216]